MKHLLLTILLAFVSLGASGQTVGLKTNLIDDALLSVNLGVEVGMSPKWSFDMPMSLNNWTLSDGKRWKHWYAQPGVRYWFCDRFSGHFVGVHLHGGQYNIGGFDGKVNFLGTDFRNLADRRYQGWFAGGGISYGYAWVLGKHWNMEAELGVGYAYSRYDEFRCKGCGSKLRENLNHNYFGVTKASVNLVYLF